MFAKKLKGYPFGQKLTFGQISLPPRQRYAENALAFLFIFKYSIFCFFAQEADGDTLLLLCKITTCYDQQDPKRRKEK